MRRCIHSFTVCMFVHTVLYIDLIFIFAFNPAIFFSSLCYVHIHVDHILFNDILAVTKLTTSLFFYMRVDHVLICIVFPMSIEIST
jgi:hypothetical protein